MQISAYRSRRTEAAFTLVELLLVLVVIVVLSSLLLPAMRLVRETAHSAKCMSNMRQMSMACRLYADDHRGVMPPASFSNWDRPNFPLIIAAEYLVSSGGSQNSIRSVLVCPADKKPDGFPYANGWGPDGIRAAVWTGGSAGVDNPWMIIVQTSYCYNVDGFNNGYYTDIAGHAIPRRATTIPSTMALFWDSNCAWSSIASGNLFFSNRHNRGVNMAFSDCSVRWYGFPKAKAGEDWMYISWSGFNDYLAYWGTTARHCIGPNAGNTWLDGMVATPRTEPWTSPN